MKIEVISWHTGFANVDKILIQCKRIICGSMFIEMDQNWTAAKNDLNSQNNFKNISAQSNSNNFWN